MSWSTRFRIRQYVKGSLWLVPLLGGLLGLARRRDRSARRPGRRPPARLGVLRVDRERRADDDRRRDRGAHRVRRHRQRARRPDGDRHLLGALPAALVPRPDAQGAARRARRDARLLVHAARAASRATPCPTSASRSRACCSSSRCCSSCSSSTASCTGCGRSPSPRSSRRPGARAFADATRHVGPAAPPGDAPDVGAAGSGSPCGATGAGAIQAIDVRGLVRFAEERDCVLVFRHAVGDFVLTGGGARRRRRRRRDARDAERDPRAGRARDRAHDRAGSRVRRPDPRRHRDQGALARGQRPDDGRPGARTTSATCCGLIATAELTGRVEVRDAAGRVRLVLPARRWEDYLALGVTEIRQLRRELDPGRAPPARAARRAAARRCGRSTARRSRTSSRGSTRPSPSTSAPPSTSIARRRPTGRASAGPARSGDDSPPQDDVPAARAAKNGAAMTVSPAGARPMKLPTGHGGEGEVAGAAGPAARRHRDRRARDDVRAASLAARPRSRLVAPRRGPRAARRARLAARRDVDDRPARDRRARRRDGRLPARLAACSASGGRAPSARSSRCSCCSRSAIVILLLVLGGIVAQSDAIAAARDRRGRQGRGAG